jgi:hypothetical protein
MVHNAGGCMLGTGMKSIDRRTFLKTVPAVAATRRIRV